MKRRLFKIGVLCSIFIGLSSLASTGAIACKKNDFDSAKNINTLDSNAENDQKKVSKSKKLLTKKRKLTDLNAAPEASEDSSKSEINSNSEKHQTEEPNLKLKAKSKTIFDFEEHLKEHAKKPNVEPKLKCETSFLYPFDKNKSPSEITTNVRSFVSSVIDLDEKKLEKQKKEFRQKSLNKIHKDVDYWSNFYENHIKNNNESDNFCVLNYDNDSLFVVCLRFCPELFRKKLVEKNLLKGNEIPEISKIACKIYYDDKQPEECLFKNVFTVSASLDALEAQHVHMKQKSSMSLDMQGNVFSETAEPDLKFSEDQNYKVEILYDGNVVYESDSVKAVRGNVQPYLLSSITDSDEENNIINEDKKNAFVRIARTFAHANYYNKDLHYKLALQESEFSEIL